MENAEKAEIIEKLERAKARAQEIEGLPQPLDAWQAGSLSHHRAHVGHFVKRFIEKL